MRMPACLRCGLATAPTSSAPRALSSDHPLRVITAAPGDPTVPVMTATSYSERRISAATPALFGRVMALVAVTVGFATLGVWVARGWGGAGWFIAWLLALGCLVGLNVANSRGQTSLAVVLLLAFGLLMGASVATTVNYYAATDPTAVRQAFGATALFVAALGSGGYAVRRDLSFLYR